MTDKAKTALVVSAHSADFVWRAGGAREHLWDYYTRVALQRGVQATRNSNLKIKFAEAYQRVFPQVTGELA